MQILPNNFRYALRQFRMAPIFTATAILTLALGIGGTTAIFTLIHAVMLRSLPVGDPSALYRIGDGDDCCVEGGTQDRWGMFSFPFYERLKTETPEFDQLTAFQAGLKRVSVRREGVEQASRPLRSEYVTGNYFATLGIGSLGGRVLSPEDDMPSAAPVAVLSHRAWQTAYASDPSVVGSPHLRLKAIRSRLSAWGRPDFSAKRCAAILPICGFRSSRSRLSAETLHCCASQFPRGCA